MAAPKVDSALTAFLEEQYLRPHSSPITADMIVGLEERFGIHPLWTLVILGAESSLGDPVQGGELARRSNFGCLKAAVRGSWSELADGTIRIRGTDWYTFPTAAAGMEAWGRYLSGRQDGLYIELLSAGDLRAFAAIYYGESVEGFPEYAAGLYERAAGVRAKARAAGFDWWIGRARGRRSPGSRPWRSRTQRDPRDTHDPSAI